MFEKRIFPNMRQTSCQLKTCFENMSSIWKDIWIRTLVLDQIQADEASWCGFPRRRPL